MLSLCRARGGVGGGVTGRRGGGKERDRGGEERRKNEKKIYWGIVKGQRDE